MDKSIEAFFLDLEDKEVKTLKNIYTRAGMDVANRIQIFDSQIGNLTLKDLDKLPEGQASIIRSKIYQRDYQKQLKEQIDLHMKDLHSKVYSNVSDYMKDHYEAGYLASMYQMNKAGIPIMMPFSEKEVSRAMKLDSRLSKNLYDSLGENVELLKKRVANNVARGVATGSTHKQIAHNIQSGTNIGFNNAMRIARTESHRVQVLSQLDAGKKANSKGADVFKQWDATLDGRTRPTHRMLDGQIVGLDEKFKGENGEVVAPAFFGIPSEDINCRCKLNFRPRWALDLEELEALQDRAYFYGIDKRDSFEEFKKKFNVVQDPYKRKEKLEELTAQWEKKNKSLERRIAVGKRHLQDWERVKDALTFTSKSQLQQDIRRMMQEQELIQRRLKIARQELKDIEKALAEKDKPFRMPKGKYSNGKPFEYTDLHDEAGEWYVSGDGMWINEYYRNPAPFGELSENEKKLANALDELTKSSVVQEEKLYRSVDASVLFGDMSQLDYENLYEALAYPKNASRLAERAKERVERKIGTTIEEKGFMSTTKSMEIADDFGSFTGSTKPVVMEINVPKGKIHGYDMKKWEIIEDPQEEILLSRGQKFEIKRIEYKNNNIHVEVDLVPDNNSLSKKLSKENLKHKNAKKKEEPKPTPKKKEKKKEEPKPTPKKKEEKKEEKKPSKKKEKTETEKKLAETKKEKKGLTDKRKELNAKKKALEERYVEASEKSLSASTAQRAIKELDLTEKNVAKRIKELEKRLASIDDKYSVEYFRASRELERTRKAEWWLKLSEYEREKVKAMPYEISKTKGEIESKLAEVKARIRELDKQIKDLEAKILEESEMVDFGATETLTDKQIKALEARCDNIIEEIIELRDKEFYYTQRLVRPSLSDTERERIMKEAKETIEKRQNLAKEFTDLKKKQYNTDDMSDITDIIANLKRDKVSQKPYKMHDKPMSHEDIVMTLGGGDNAGGSCASVGLAYIGQRGGLNVLDFRGGASRKFFCKYPNLRRITDIPSANAISFRGSNDIKAGIGLLNQAKVGKEYYMFVGGHASIVRRTASGHFEYLELQHPIISKCGWTRFSDDLKTTLVNRFGCEGLFEYTGYMIDVDSFKDSAELKEILKYINTAESKQKKGIHGQIR